MGTTSMRTGIVLVGLLAVCLGAIPDRPRKSYEGYKVIEVTPTTEHQLKTLQKMRNNIELDFWTEPRGLGLPVMIMVAPSALDTMRMLMSATKLHVSVVNENVEETVE